jgi:putative colanic acid biosynthesis UDP-glucose lipid carrier transferase
MDYCDGIKLISLRTEPLENPFNRFLKRTFDIAISLPVVIFILPVLSPIVWLFQIFQSPGRLFYWQTRAGLGNRKFQILKFRTMHGDHGAEARQARKNDSRVYPAGRWLRKLSLDEFPQFVNVLLGDMSVVGPRPHLVQHNKEFEKELSQYNIRSFVKPGITGLAQVRGFRGETLTRADLTNRIESDLYYIENWTFTLDIVIVFRTFWHMIRPPEKSV